MGMSHHFLTLAAGAAELQRRGKSLKPRHVFWECTRYRERKTSTKPSGNRKWNWLAARCSWSGASPATHTRGAFVCGGDRSKVKDVPRLDPLRSFPQKAKHISASTSVGVPRHQAGTLLTRSQCPVSRCSFAGQLHKPREVWNDTCSRTPIADVPAISEQSYSWDLLLAAAGRRDGVSQGVQMSLAGLNEQSSAEFN